MIGIERDIGTIYNNVTFIICERMTNLKLLLLRTIKKHADRVCAGHFVLLYTLVFVHRVSNTPSYNIMIVL